MIPEILEVCKRMVAKHDFKEPVVEVGGFDVNGNVKQFFVGKNYLTTDLKLEKNVEVVLDIESFKSVFDFTQEHGFFNSVVCTEVFEHLKSPFDAAKNIVDSGMIFAKDDGSINDDIQYRITAWNYATPKFHFELGNTANTLFRASSIDVSLGVWYFVSTTFDSSTGVMNIYLNGVYSGTDTFTGTRVTASTAAFIGRRHNGIYYSGYLKNFMLFERVLTANEIKKLYEETYIE